MTPPYGANPKMIVDVWRLAVAASMRYWERVADREQTRKREDDAIASANEPWERRQRLGAARVSPSASAPESLHPWKPYTPSRRTPRASSGQFRVRTSRS